MAARKRTDRSVTRSSGRSEDEFGAFGLDAGEDDFGGLGDGADDVAEAGGTPCASLRVPPSVCDPSADVVTVNDLLRMRDATVDSEPAETTADPAATWKAPHSPPGDPLERRGIGRDVVAVTVVATPGRPGTAMAVPPRPEQAPDRRRLAAVMLGVGGVLDRMEDGTAMSAVDVEAARGLAAGLASEAETVEVQVLAQLAAGAVVLENRLMAAAARSAVERSPDTAQSALNYARAASTGFCLVQRTLEAVHLARARRRDRTSIPVFMVARVGEDGAKSGTGG